MAYFVGIVDLSKEREKKHRKAQRFLYGFLSFEGIESHKNYIFYAIVAMTAISKGTK